MKRNAEFIEIGHRMLWQWEQGVALSLKAGLSKPPVISQIHARVGKAQLYAPPSLALLKSFVRLNVNRRSDFLRCSDRLPEARFFFLGEFGDFWIGILKQVIAQLFKCDIPFSEGRRVLFFEEIRVYVRANFFDPCFGTAMRSCQQRVTSPCRAGGRRAVHYLVPQEQTFVEV